MSTKKMLGSAAFAIALLGGGAAGAMLGAPVLSGAATDQSAVTTTAPDGSADAGAQAPDERGPRRGGAGLEAAATALDMTVEELRTALADGDKTIAAVAEEQGVDVQTVIDAMVAAETEAIDERAAEAKANLVEQVTEGVNNGFAERGPGGPGGHGGPGGERGGHLMASLDTAAEALGLTPEELRTALDGGEKTLADVAGDQGVEVQTVIDALVGEANTRIDEKVAAGDLTAEEGAERKADAVERITEMVNEGGPRHR